MVQKTTKSTCYNYKHRSKNTFFIHVRKIAFICILQKEDKESINNIITYISTSILRGNHFIRETALVIYFIFFFLITFFTYCTYLGCIPAKLKIYTLYNVNYRFSVPAVYIETWPYMFIYINIYLYFIFCISNMT